MHASKYIFLYLILFTTLPTLGKEARTCSELQGQGVQVGHCEDEDKIKESDKYVCVIYSSNTDNSSSGGGTDDSAGGGSNSGSSDGSTDEQKTDLSGCINLAQLVLKDGGAWSSDEWKNFGKTWVEKREVINNLFKNLDKSAFQKVGRSIDCINGCSHDKEDAREAQATYNALANQLSHTKRDYNQVKQNVDLFAGVFTKEMAEARKAVSLETTPLSDVAGDNVVSDETYYDQVNYPFDTPVFTPEGQRLKEARTYRLFAADQIKAYGAQDRQRGEKMIGHADMYLGLADQFYQDGTADGYFLGERSVDIARNILDVVTNFIPGVGFGKDLLYATTGYNWILGRELTAVEMAITVGTFYMPAMISGTSKVVAKIAVKLEQMSESYPEAKALYNILKSSDETLAKNIGKSVCEGSTCAKVGTMTDEVIDSAKNIGFKTTEEINHNKGVLERWKSSFTSTKIDDAAVINRELAEIGYSKPPYTEGAKVVSFKPQDPTDFVRVHGDTNQGGRWVMNRKDIEGLTPSQIKEKFALPDLPTKVSDVTVPGGTGMRVGPAASNYGSQGGGIQFEVLERVDFRNARPLGDL